jgi:hypothetical protein
MTTHKFDNIPGLYLFDNYFAPDACQKMIDDSIELYQQLEAATQHQHTQKAHIPQPEFVRSAQHNLSSEESYISVSLPTETDRKLRCEYFPNYGEEGHALAYFRGNQHLPDFIKANLLEQLQTTLQAENLAPSDKPLHWKLTANYYKNTGENVAGFPFHVDIPANGVVTMIMNIQREARFQIAKDDTMQEINLSVGSLLVLSGESRYDWKHRVLPTQGQGIAEDIERISLVLGFK